MLQCPLLEEAALEVVAQATLVEAAVDGSEVSDDRRGRRDLLGEPKRRLDPSQNTLCLILRRRWPGSHSSKVPEAAGGKSESAVLPPLGRHRCISFSRPGTVRRGLGEDSSEEAGSGLPGVRGGGWPV